MEKQFRYSMFKRNVVKWISKSVQAEVVLGLGRWESEREDSENTLFVPSNARCHRLLAYFSFLFVSRRNTTVYGAYWAWSTTQNNLRYSKAWEGAQVSTRWNCAREKFHLSFLVVARFKVDFKQHLMGHEISFFFPLLPRAFVVRFFLSHPHSIFKCFIIVSELESERHTCH